MVEITKLTRYCFWFSILYFSIIGSKTYNIIVNFDGSSLIYNERFYNEWSSWTACSRSCNMSRQKFCKGPPFTNTRHCPVKTIVEIKSCDCCGCDSISKGLTTLDVLPKSCGKRSEDNRKRNKIIGGEPTQVDKWPWTVNLGSMMNREMFINCGATLISDRWAITAAHCMKPYISPDYKLGELTKVKKNTKIINIGNYHRDRIDKSEYYVYISHIIVHPQFYTDDTVTIYDFAMMRLENRIKNLNAKFPCIVNEMNFRLDQNAVCYAVGWETEIHGNRVFDDRLQETQIPLVSYQKCREEYMNIYINYSLHICAGSKKKDTCTGDSGSGLYCLDPLTKNWLLYGIVSFGTNLGCGSSMGVYARISAVKNWIADVITLY